MQTSPKVPEGYRICPFCRNFSLAREQQNFCIWCGSKLVEHCAACSKPIVYPYARFCYHCGTRYGFAQLGHEAVEQEMLKRSGVTQEVWARQEGRRPEARFPIPGPLTPRKT